MDKPPAELVALCESPIERRLLGPLFRATRELGADLKPQAEIGPFRADFLITHGDARLVVEADGKAWHTGKRQQKRDRSRDAWMRAHGYGVVRFTGTEIHRSAVACARAVIARLGEPTPPTPNPEPRVRKVGATKPTAQKTDRDDAVRAYLAAHPELYPKPPAARGVPKCTFCGERTTRICAKCTRAHCRGVRCAKSCNCEQLALKAARKAMNKAARSEPAPF